MRERICPVIILMNRNKKRYILPIVFCSAALFVFDVNADAAAGVPQADSVQSEAAGDIWQQQAELAAANAEAYQKAQEQYAAELAAYQQALLEQQAREKKEAQTQQSLAEADNVKPEEADGAASPTEAGPAVIPPAQSLQTLPQNGTIANGRLIAAGLLSAPVETPLKGKSISILGDSISTYQGYIPSGYACFYPETQNDVKDVTQTWWMQVLYNTGMRLAVNGSYSASAVCGDSQAEDSSAGCSTRRINELMGTDGTVPDVILVYMGANDCFRSMELGKFNGITGRGENIIPTLRKAMN